VFPAALRPPPGTGSDQVRPGGVNWRFRVPDGRGIEFFDANRGDVRRTAGVDFGDFLVWRKDGFPSYELAVVADDHAMQISEVVRGEDLLTSTARQLCATKFGWPSVMFYQCPLVRDETELRLAACGRFRMRGKRHTPDGLLCASSFKPADGKVETNGCAIANCKLQIDTAHWRYVGH
jgi:glutamyl-tRNA synthetase